MLHLRPLISTMLNGSHLLGHIKGSQSTYYSQNYSQCEFRSFYLSITSHISAAGCAVMALITYNYNPRTYLSLNSLMPNDTSWCHKTLYRKHWMIHLGVITEHAQFTLFSWHYKFGTAMSATEVTALTQCTYPVLSSCGKPFSYGKSTYCVH